MEIGRRLMKVRAGQLRDRYLKLEHKTAELGFEEAEALKVFVRLKREETEMLLTTLDTAPEIKADLNRRLIETLQRLKKDYHLAHRRWQSLYPSQTRRRLSIAA